MTSSAGTDAVSFDTTGMLDAVEDTIEGTLRSLVAFNESGFDLLYIDELSEQFYEDEEQMMAHFEEIHSYVHVDFTEKSFYTEDLFPIADRVRFLATSFDVFTVVRIYFGDEGLFLVVDRDEPVEPIVEAVEGVYERNQ